jgi:hypothetical protein
MTVEHRLSRTVVLEKQIASVTVYTPGAGFVFGTGANLLMDPDWRDSGFGAFREQKSNKQVCSCFKFQQ